MPNWKKLVVSGSNASLNNLIVQNAITASYFVGNGSGLTNLNVDIAEQTTVSDSFTSTTSRTVTHNFGTKNVLVQVFDNSDNLIIPSSITTTDTNTVSISFNNNTSGRVVVAKGGHIATLQVPEVATVTGSFTSLTQTNVEHNFNTKNVIVNVYDDTDRLIIPDSIITSDNNSVDISFSQTTSGRVVVAKGGHLVSGSTQTYRENISGASAYAVTHSLSEDFPIVQVYSTERSQVIPAEITTTSANSLNLTFSSTFSGTVVVKK